MAIVLLASRVRYLRLSLMKRLSLEALMSVSTGILSRRVTFLLLTSF